MINNDLFERCVLCDFPNSATKPKHANLCSVQLQWTKQLKATSIIHTPNKASDYLQALQLSQKVPK